MHILISNDDGYEAPGIIALARLARSFGRVTVVAPQRNQSGTSNGLSLGRDLAVERRDATTLVVDGTSADCVHLAFTGPLREDRPDLVISGVNGGCNLGDDTIYSGTVAAAREGFIFGVNAIAFSQVEPGWAELESALEVARRVIEKVLGGMDRGSPLLLNVNIPNLPLSDLRGLLVARLGRRRWAGPAHVMESAAERHVYRLGEAGAPLDDGEGTDFWAVAHGHASITPLAIDLTDRPRLSALARWLQAPSGATPTKDPAK